MVNRTQALVLGFFVLAVASLLVILAVAPEVYDQALRLPTGSRAVEIGLLAALVGFIGLVVVAGHRCGGVWGRPGQAGSVAARQHRLPGRWATAGAGLLRAGWGR